MLTPLLAMVRKDLQLFFSDRRAVIMGFVAPIAIASFFGSIFSGPGNSGEAARIPVALVDQDHSPVSLAISTDAAADNTLAVSHATADEARDGVRRGSITVAVVIPAGFGDAAGRAFFAGRDKPVLTMWYDPSHAAELGLVRGLMTEHVMTAVSAEMFSGASGRTLVDETLNQLDTAPSAGTTGIAGMSDAQRGMLRDLLQSARKFYDQPQSAPAAGERPRGISMPYTVATEAVTSGENVAYNGYAHSFAGMGIQFVLFASIDLGIGILLERQRGLWKRLRSAPLSRASLLGGKAASGALIALMTLLVSFAFAMVVFKVRIQGSLIGFLAVAVACALMASTFGLLIASLGRTPGGTRGVAILAVLLMVMLGGAWVPTFIFPAWLQRVTVVVPARWAVDGLDAMTWRGLGLGAAVLPTLVLLGFALLFAVLAVARFRWEEA
jgi:ABC-2 type transport system permease protein